MALDRASFMVLTEQHAWLRSVMAFLVSIRPAWWVLRGYLAAWALWSLLAGMRGLRPHGVLQLAMALAAVVISVQLGRGWLRHRAMTRPVLVLANATAVVVALVGHRSPQPPGGHSHLDAAGGHRPADLERAADRDPAGDPAGDPDRDTDGQGDGLGEGDIAGPWKDLAGCPPHFHVAGSFGPANGAVTRWAGDLRAAAASGDRPAVRVAGAARYWMAGRPGDFRNSDRAHAASG